MSPEEAKGLLSQGRLKEALDGITVYLKSRPEDIEALYLQAVCFRYLENTDAALKTLRDLLALKSDYPRAWQEIGHCYRTAGSSDDAIRAYEQALAMNPALVASLRCLKSYYHQNRQSNELTRVNQLLAYWESLPLPLVTTMSLIYEGQLLQAEELCRNFLKEHPRHVEGMRILAHLGVHHQIFDDAEFLLESALSFEPENRAVQQDYIAVLHKRQKFAKAHEQAKQLLDCESDNPDYQLIFANQSAAIGDYESAVKIYDELHESQPQSPYPVLLKGHALKTVGKQTEAVKSYHEACRIKPDFGDAFWSLANLKTYEFSDSEIQLMQDAIESDATGREDRLHLYFALGKAYEDRQAFEKSFRCYENGNAIKKEQSRYRSARTEAEFKRQMAVCDEALFSRSKGCGYPARDPIFIVGLPRAGSTLLEQILASHPDVDGTLELPNILAMAHRLNGRRQLNEEAIYPGILQGMEDEKLAALGLEFIESTRIYRQSAPRFTDKMPNNFRHIGLIQMILPNAKIIDARRHPLACCFSGYKQLFAEGQEFTYSLEDMGHYYKHYVDLMAHWDRVLPGKILRVHYEDVVQDIETQVRRMLDYLDLPFDSACLTYHQTNRSVRTASSEQVRQPLYESGIEQWRHFEAWLDPLKNALGDSLYAYRE